MRSGNMRIMAIIAALCGCTVFAADWPNWRGGDYSGVTSEQLKWRDGAPVPEPAWLVNVGEGCGSMAVADGRLYTMGWSDGMDTVFCLDKTDGKVLWKQFYKAPKYGRNSQGDKGLYSGPTSTPTHDVATGLLFTLGADGDPARAGADARGRGGAGAGGG